MNKLVAQVTAKKIVHLVAKDERRYNFSLNKSNADIALPGVHYDLGGGYRPDMVERVLLSKPSYNEVLHPAPKTSSTSYTVAKAQLEKLKARYSRYDLPLEISLWEEDIVSNVRGDRSHATRVHAAVSVQREVRNDLSLVYLRIMRELAVRHGVPFEPIDESDTRLALPAELVPIAQKLMAYAQGNSSTYGLSETEERLLYKRYVHLSSHWNPVTHRNAQRDLVFINRPGENDVRTEHPNE